MFPVSDAYKLAVADSHRKSKMRAVLTIGSTVINLDDSDIIKDTVYISNQCTNGNEYEYGCVYSAECGITIKSAVDRYRLYDAELKLFWSLWTGTEWEEIPLGVYYISEPNRINDKISIKALDGMTKLDVNVDEDTQGTMVQLIPYIAGKCGVEVAQTTEELSEFVNSNVQWSVYEDKVETYRDLLAYICMMSCCFATFDRYGKLKLVPYATSSSVTLRKKQRFQNAQFSDYTTKFRGVKARFIAEENYAPSEVKDDTKNGLILDMGDIPIVRGIPDNKNKWLSNVYDVLQNVSYTPCEIETLGNPAIDLGDLITNENVGKENNTYISPVTAYTWNYRGKQKIKAVGGNPKLADVKSREDRHMSSLEGSIEARDIIVKTYVNADDISFKENYKDIAKFNYSATENIKIIFLMTVRLSLGLDGVVCFQFYTDSKEDTERCFRKYLERGEHFVTITELYNADTNERHTILVRACMEYYESDKRKQDADITTSKNFLEAIKTTGATVTDNVVAFPTYEEGVIDTTVATASILKGGIKAMLYGQGLAGEGQWDGTIYINEEFTAFTFSSGLSVGNLVDTVSSKLQIPTPIGFTETLSNIGFDSTLSMSDNVVEKILFKWNDNSFTWGMIVDEFTWYSAKAKTWQELKGVE